MKFLIACLLASAVESGASGQVLDTSSFPPALTSFTCHGRPPGYYADLETGCKTYHVCDGNSHFTYVCPKRTLFQQRSRICDHSYLVRCENSSHFYEATDDEEPISFPLTKSEMNLSNKGDIDHDHNETKEFITSETTPLTAETTLLTADDITETAKAPTTTTAIPTTPKPPPETSTPHSKENFSGQSSQKFLKIRLNDFRSLFFIPEFDDNSIAAKPEREFLLPVEKTEFVNFKNRKLILKTLSSCPSYCNPKFFLPGTCHPCIMIK